MVTQPGPRRIGLFGGTFDPPHLGHLMVAEWARDALRLEQVVFMPSGTPPHKRGRSMSPARARVAMTRLAVRGHPAFMVSSFEVRRSGDSYTVETLRVLRAAHPRTRLFLLLGEDSLRELPTWREPEAIVRLARLVVAPRPGEPRSGVPRSAGRRIVRLEGPVIGLSSSEIRERERTGRSIRYLVTDAVAAYIVRHRLYRRSTRGGRSAPSAR